LKFWDAFCVFFLWILDGINGHVNPIKKTRVTLFFPTLAKRRVSYSAFVEVVEYLV